MVRGIAATGWCRGGGEFIAHRSQVRLILDGRHGRPRETCLPADHNWACSNRATCSLACPPRLGFGSVLSFCSLPLQKSTNGPSLFADTRATAASIFRILLLVIHLVQQQIITEKNRPHSPSSREAIAHPDGGLLARPSADGRTRWVTVTINDHHALVAIVSKKLPYAAECKYRSRAASLMRFVCMPTRVWITHQRWQKTKRKKCSRTGRVGSMQSSNFASVMDNAALLFSPPSGLSRITSGSTLMSFGIRERNVSSSSSSLASSCSNCRLRLNSGTFVIIVT